MSKIGLVLQGGGMRGVYTAGVLDYFLEQQLYFRTVIGVSAGACNAISYISRQFGRNIAICAGQCTNRHYMSFSNLLKERSFFGIDYVFHTIPDMLIPFDYTTYENSAMSLTTVCTDCNTGAANYCEITNLRQQLPYLQGSMSIPLLSQIVNVDGCKLLDGGVADPIPLAYAAEIGCTKRLIVLTRPRGYINDEKTHMAPYKRIYGQYPQLLAALEQRGRIYNQQLRAAERLEQTGKALVIAPLAPISVGRLERKPERLVELYRQGWDDAAAQLEAIQAYCADGDLCPK